MRVDIGNNITCPLGAQSKTLKKAPCVLLSFLSGKCADLLILISLSIISKFCVELHFKIGKKKLEKNIIILTLGDQY